MANPLAQKPALAEDIASSPTKKPLLITGAGGFVGKKAAEKALADGDRVVAMLNRHGDGPQTIPPELTALKIKYRGKLDIEHADLTDEASLGRIFVRHPNIDAVLHTAAMISIPNDDLGKKLAHAVNVDGVICLAKLANEHAQRLMRPVHFHFVSSAEEFRLKERPETLQDQGTKAARTYADNKCEATSYLRTHGNEFPNLDISVTYPVSIIGGNGYKGYLSRIFEYALAAEKSPDSMPMEAQYKQMNLDKVGGKIQDLVHVDHYVVDALSCFKQPPQPGFREYTIQPDFHLKIGEIIRVAADVIDDARRGAKTKSLSAQPGEWADVGEQLEFNFEMPKIPPPPLAPERKTLRLKDVLAEQYRIIQQSKARS